MLTVDHPGCAESIEQHAESGSPEGLLERHLQREFFANALNVRSASAVLSMPRAT
jgi:hypothetical protein